MSYGDVQKVLRNLLRESIPIRTGADPRDPRGQRGQVHDPEALTELGAPAAGPRDLRAARRQGRHVHAVTLDPG